MRRLVDKFILALIAALLALLCVAIDAITERYRVNRSLEAKCQKVVNDAWEDFPYEFAKLDSPDCGLNRPVTSEGD